ncbi:MAG TPA: HAD-IG family 5'-nucleotidase [Polyangiaceae bacterium]|nr:HAD-IG family 5'-nucleotidase [Polyangiaceae bacterium]
MPSPASSSRLDAAPAAPTPKPPPATAASPADAPTPPPPAVAAAGEAVESAGQLVLPLPDLLHRGETRRVPRQRQVFVNRHLRMADVEWVGFDMDYTLAIYNQPEMDQLQIQATLPKMVARGYPAFLQDCWYDINFPIRGLVIDKKLGHILKMDRYKVVQRACHGLRELGRDELNAIYEHKRIRFTTERYHWIDVLYALSEVAMYATIVDEMERRGLPVDYAKLFRDVRECIDEAHRDLTVLEAVASDYPRFVLRDPDLALTLHKWRSAGKKLFLLTNSRWEYTDRMMRYLLGGSLPEYPTWRHYFDAICVAASKPTFFQERRPFAELEEATAAGRSRVLEGGNLHELEKRLGTTGDRILYVGDHIYGDILRSKKESAWRTAMIIQEMTAEVLALEANAEGAARLAALEDRRQRAEDEFRFWLQRYKDLSRQLEARANGPAQPLPRPLLGAEREGVRQTVDRLRLALRSLDDEIAALEKAIDRRHHPFWGALLKEGYETSSFGHQVEEYACVYTSKVSNFLAYSPRHEFRSPRERMAHEL